MITFRRNLPRYKTLRNEDFQQGGEEILNVLLTLNKPGTSEKLKQHLDFLNGVFPFRNECLLKTRPVKLLHQKKGIN